MHNVENSIVNDQFSDIEQNLLSGFKNCVEKIKQEIDQQNQELWHNNKMLEQECQKLQDYDQNLNYDAEIANEKEILSILT